jgi:ribosome-binding factor A
LDKSIKLLRTESILKQLIPEAISTLDDPYINSISVVDVKCSRGKYNATVYLDATLLNENEQKYILVHLKKANVYIKNYCKQAESWFRAPDFKFTFDTSLKYQNRMDTLFEKIDKELNKSE